MLSNPEIHDYHSSDHSSMDKGTHTIIMLEKKCHEVFMIYLDASFCFFFNRFVRVCLMIHFIDTVFILRGFEERIVSLGYCFSEVKSDQLYILEKF